MRVVCTNVPSMKEEEEAASCWLLSENFSALEYVLKRIDHTSLEQLLEQVTQEVQQILADVIQYLLENRQQVEYTVKQVKQFQQSWIKIEKKVAQIESQLSLLEKEVAKDLENSAKNLEEKRKYTNWKVALEALQRKNKTLSSAWRLLERLERGNSSSQEETDSLLEYLVVEIGRARSIHYDEELVNKELVEKVEESAKQIASRTEEQLQWWFLTCLSQVEVADSSLGRCLQCCKELELTNKVENWFAEAFVQPFIVERIDAVETSQDRLVAMKNAVNELFQYRFLENMKQADARIYTHFSFINRSILPVIVDLMKHRIVQLENVKNPDCFYRLYVGVEEIFASLEQFEKAVYPQSSIYETLEYRSFWDPELFRIYFESVELKLANQLEASLSLEHGTQGSSKFRCLATEGLEMFLKKSWSSEIWIFPITGFLLEWSLLGISRYKKYLEDYIGKTESDYSNLDSKDLVNLLWDLRSLPHWINNEFQLDTSMLRNCNVQELVEDISHLIQSWVKECSDKKEQVQQLLCNVIVSKCTENLQSLRGILAAYRMTTKPVPKHHSPFVVNILRPLKDILPFLSEEKEQDQLKKQIIDTVCQQLVERYAAMTREIVSSVRKAEDTLKRLNLGRSSQSTESVSDLEKIQRQLELDGKKLREELDQLGFSVSDDSLL